MRAVIHTYVARTESRSTTTRRDAHADTHEHKHTHTHTHTRTHAHMHSHACTTWFDRLSGSGEETKDEAGTMNSSKKN